MLPFMRQEISKRRHDARRRDSRHQDLRPVYIDGTEFARVVDFDEATSSFYTVTYHAELSHRFWRLGLRPYKARVVRPARSSYQARANIDLRCKRSVNRAFIGDLKQLSTLLLSQRAGQFNITLNMVEQALFGFTLRTVRGVNLGMSQVHSDAFKRPLLAPCVHGHGHRSAGPQRGQQEIVRRRPGIRTADRDRLIACEAMSPDGNLLGEAVRRSKNAYRTRHGCAVFCCICRH